MPKSHHTRKGVSRVHHRHQPSIATNGLSHVVVEKRGGK